MDANIIDWNNCGYKEDNTYIIHLKTVIVEKGIYHHHVCDFCLYIKTAQLYQISHCSIALLNLF